MRLAGYRLLLAEAIGDVFRLQRPAVLQVVVPEGERDVSVLLPFVVMTVPCAGIRLVRIRGVRGTVIFI